MKKDKMRNFINKFKRVAMLAITGLTLAVTSPALLVSANEDLGVGQIDVKDIISSGTSLEEGPLSELGEKVDDIGGGAYGIFYKAGVWLAVISLMIVGFGLMFSNAGNRGEQKSKFGSTVLGIILVFAAVSLVVFCQSIGMNLFEI